MKTSDYLQAAKAKTGAKRNRDLAKALELSDAALCRYESGERVMDDYTAAKVAEILGIEPMRIIAQANAEREKDTKRKAFWEAMTMGGIAASLFMLFGTNLVPWDPYNLLIMAGFTAPSGLGTFYYVKSQTGAQEFPASSVLRESFWRLQELGLLRHQVEQLKKELERAQADIGFGSSAGPGLSCLWSLPAPGRRSWDHLQP